MSHAKIITAMILLESDDSFNLNNFLNDFKHHYEEQIEDINGDNSSLVFKIKNELTAIAHIPFPVPSQDIKEASEYAYNWQTALENLKSQKGHLLVTIFNDGEDQIKRFRIFTMVISSLLRNTNSLGVYKGNQSLLIPKNDYLNEALLMSEDYLPINLWIYFGLRITEKGNSGYTYGLKEFNKMEMEILNSSKSPEEIRSFLFSISHYVLCDDVTFKNGQTCGLSNAERIAITFSKSKFVEGESFKLAY